MPGPGSSIKSSLSMKSVLAHEVVGHRQTTLAKKAFEAGSLNDEVQASWRAARLSPNLSRKERYDLLRDAVRRLKAEGVNVRDLDKSKFYLE
jgi:hypothetical protein